jgi:hypothetical protein
VEEHHDQEVQIGILMNRRIWITIELMSNNRNIIIISSNGELLAEGTTCFLLGNLLIVTLAFRLDFAVTKYLAEVAIEHEELVGFEIGRTVVLYSLDGMFFDLINKIAGELYEWAVKTTICVDDCFPSAIEEDGATEGLPDI